LPRTRVVFYREREGNVPVLEWLDTLPANIQDKCVVKIERLRELGHELRRPEADLLRDGIYELRIGREGMKYRMLYFFHGRVAAVLTRDIVKSCGLR
jgi:phage-related protein